MWQRVATVGTSLLDVCHHKALPDSWVILCAVQRRRGGGDSDLIDFCLWLRWGEGIVGREGTLGGHSGEDVAVLSESEAMAVGTGVVEFWMERNRQFETIVGK